MGVESMTTRELINIERAVREYVFRQFGFKRTAQIERLAVAYYRVRFTDGGGAVVCVRGDGTMSVTEIEEAC